MNKTHLSIVFNDFDDIRNPLLAAGQAHATVEVAQGLIKRGHRVTVLCSKYPGAKDRRERGIYYKHIGVGTKSLRFNNFIYPLALPLIVKKTPADVFIDCFTAPFSTLCTPLFTNTPVIGIPTSFEAHEFTKKYRFPFHIIEKFGARTYSYFLPYTKHYADKMLTLNPHINQQIIPEGVGDEYFAIKKTEPQHILFLGRIDIHQKGLDLLLHAWKEVHAVTHYPLVIAGRGPDEVKLRSLISQLDLEKSVKVVGPAYGKKKKQLLASSLLVVFPSRHEGFSLFGLEALASGNMLIGFDIPGLSWAHSSSVVKVATLDAKAFAHTLIKLLKNPKDISLRNIKAKSYARRYSWDKVSQQWHTFITKITNTNI